MLNTLAIYRTTKKAKVNFYREYFLYLCFFLCVIFLQDREHNSPASLSVPSNVAEQTSLEKETLAIIYSFLSHLIGNFVIINFLEYS